MNYFIAFTHTVVALIALKALLIGSDFNFLHYFRHRGKYIRWYNNRDEFNDD